LPGLTAKKRRRFDRFLQASGKLECVLRDGADEVAFAFLIWSLARYKRQLVFKGYYPFRAHESHDLLQSNTSLVDADVARDCGVFGISPRRNLPLLDKGFQAAAINVPSLACNVKFSPDDVPEIRQVDGAGSNYSGQVV
jgi:hypothetical protein